MRIILHLLFFLSGTAMVAAQTPAILKDLNVGTKSGFQTGGKLEALNGKLYFAGYGTNQLSNQLFVTDGTTAGTQPVSSASNAVEIEALVSTGKKIFFKAFQNGPALFVTDGTSTTKVRNFGGPYLEGIIPFDETRVLLAVQTNASFDPDQLWISDGTPSGTFLLKAYSADPTFLTVTKWGNQTLLYDNSTTFDKMPPLITDGTAAGTQTVKDWLAPWYKFETISSAYSAGDLLFFNGKTLSGGFLYNKSVVSNGTALGTKEYLYGDEVRWASKFKEKYFLYTGRYIDVYDPVKKEAVRISKDIGFRSKLLLHNDKLYFTNDENFSLTLWESDGTTAGTKTTGAMISTNTLFSTVLLPFNNRLFFTKQEMQNVTLEQYHTTTKVVTKVSDLYQYEGLIYTSALKILNNKLLFPRTTTNEGNELWTFDLSAILSAPAFSKADDITLEWHSGSASGVISGADATGLLTIRLYDLQGRLLQQTETPGNVRFQCVPFQGVAALTVAGKYGAKSFKVFSNP